MHAEAISEKEKKIDRTLNRNETPKQVRGDSRFIRE